MWTASRMAIGSVRYAGGTVGEGPYVDGERHGHWVLRWDGGGAEGPFVNGKEHGHWVYRSADGVALILSIHEATWSPTAIVDVVSSAVVCS